MIKTNPNKTWDDLGCSGRIIYMYIKFKMWDPRLDMHTILRYLNIISIVYICSRRGLPIDRARHKEKGQPLCMEQYYKLFTSYRIPGVKKDSLISNHTNLMPEPEHIIVICKNQVKLL